MQKKIQDILVIGFALFAMFFGAGNFILPPSLGAVSGSSWIVAFLGFFVTGVGMPILGVVSIALVEGDLKVFTKALPEKLATLFLIVIILIIGPIFAIPRTAATTFEVGILPIFSDLNLNEFYIQIIGIISKVVFFIICLLFVLNRSNVLDKIGKILTPILLAVLLLLILRGIFQTEKLGGGFAKSTQTNLFRFGFKEGYQTMDALASMLFATMIVINISNRGYNTKAEVFKVSVWVGILACLSLALVYMGITYLGAGSNISFPIEIERTKRLIGIANNLWGKSGLLILCASMSLACLTTATGLIATASSYFSDKFNLSYKLLTYIVTGVSFLISLIGVDAIIVIAGPVLEIVYPVAIILIITSLFPKAISPMFIRGATLGSLFVTVPTIIASIGNLKKLQDFLESLLFAGFGLSWLTPALIFGFAFLVFEKLLNSKKLNA